MNRYTLMDPEPPHRDGEADYRWDQIKDEVIEARHAADKQKRDAAQDRERNRSTQRPEGTHLHGREAKRAPTE